MGQFSPGPDMILLTRTALGEGVRAGVETAFGIACGLTVHASVAVAGLALAFDKMPLLAAVMRWAAAIYLLWLAWEMARKFSGTTSIVEARDHVERPASRRAFARGLTCNLLNPKAALFLAAVSAPFLRGDRPDWWAVAIWSIIVCQAFLLWSLWAALLQWPPLRTGYRRAERWIDAAFAVTLAILAFRLVS